MKIIIETPRMDLYDAIIKMLGPIEVLGGDDLVISMDGKPLKGKPVDGALRESHSQPRIQYRAILPTLKNGNIDKKAALKVIDANIKTLGEHTLKALLYRDFAEAALQGNALTEPEVRKTRFAGVAGTSQREVGDLCRIELLKKEPIVHTAK